MNPEPDKVLEGTSGEGIGNDASSTNVSAKGTIKNVRISTEKKGGI